MKKIGRARKSPPRQWDGVWRRGESVPRRGVAESEMLTHGVGVQGLHPEVTSRGVV